MAASMNSKSKKSGVGVHQALRVPELLDAVFSLLDKEDNARNTLVCKEWSALALDAVWRDVDNLKTILDRLSPIRYSHDRGHFFISPPNKNDWDNFYRYRMKIRRLVVVDSDDFQPKSNRFSRDTFTTIARAKIYPIFPALHTLEWLGPTKDTLIFVSEGIKHLIMTPLADGISHSLLLDLRFRVPSLSSLVLGLSSHPFCEEEDEVLHFLQEIPQLRKFSLPEYAFTARIVSQLSKMPKLNVIDIHDDIDPPGEEPDTDIFSSAIAAGAFPALVKLSLYAPLVEVDHLLHKLLFPENLTSLCIFQDKYWNLDESPDELHGLLSTIASSCQLLSHLSLNITGFPPDDIESLPDDQIRFDTLEPLLLCPNIIKFELYHEFPVKIKQAELEQLARRWPLLEEFHLNSQPLVKSRPTLGLDALLPFALHCPKLRRLGLYISADAGKRVRMVYASGNVVKFSSLQTLTMGMSPVSSAKTVAQLLSQVCPRGCQITGGGRWDGESFSGPNDVHEFNRRSRSARSEWESVNKILSATANQSTSGGKSMQMIE